MFPDEEFAFRAAAGCWLPAVVRAGAGATAVQIGTANFYEPAITIRLIRELSEFCEARGLDSVRSLIGAVKI